MHAYIQHSFFLKAQKNCFRNFAKFVIALTNRTMNLEKKKNITSQSQAPKIGKFESPKQQFDTPRKVIFHSQVWEHP